MKYKKLRISLLIILCFCILTITVNASYYFDGGIELIPPDKTVYYEGETIDLTGLEINELSGIVREFPHPVTGELIKDVQITSRSPLTDVTVDLEGKPLTLEDKIVTVTGKGWFLSSYTETFEITVLPLPDYKITIVSNNFEKGKDIEGGIVEFTVNNGSEEEKEITVLLGIYDSFGEMVYVKTQPLEAKLGDNSDSFKDINIKDMETGEYTIKILCLDSVKSLSPLALTAVSSFEIEF